MTKTYRGGTLDDNDLGPLLSDCPACGSLLSPTLHTGRNYWERSTPSLEVSSNRSPTCQAGCSPEWQPKVPHLRWSCARCGFADERWCSEVLPGYPEPEIVDPEDIPW